jgi:prepilin-type N-terminal cleavage/methylation domain-containing protein
MMFKVLKPKSPQQERGFTLVEVLVAILIATIFTLAAMQALVVAAVFKVRAQQFAKATAWIQEELETVKDEAAKFKYTSLAAATAAGASSINVATVNGFAVNDTLRVGSDPGSYIISNISGNTLTITPSLGTAQPQDAVLEAATYTLLTANAAAGASSIDVAAVNDFAVNDTLKVGSDSGTYRISSISGNTLTITSTLGTPLETAQLQNTPVVETPSTSLTASAAADASSIDVAAVNDFAVNDTLRVGSDSGSYRISSISGNTLSITPNLAAAQSSGALVVANKSCNSRSIVAKFAEKLRDPDTGSNQIVKTETFNFTGKDFHLTRTATPSGPNEPYNVIKVTYDVSPTSGGSSVANFYTEVIPNAALQCP